MFGYVRTMVEKFFGLRITRISTEDKRRLADVSPEIWNTIERARPYTMTSPERLATLCMAVEYVIGNQVPGSYVECGVWRGGSSMAAAWTFARLGHLVDLFLFDTFEGMSEPTEEDVSGHTGQLAALLLADANQESEIKAYAPIMEVHKNMESTTYPKSHIHYVQGKVEDTLPAFAPDQISILRLDTDWYESTKHELLHLFPRLSRNGILIIDDYGAWVGARKAVDEYFKAQGLKPFLARIDGTGRVYVKL
jgi:O-methyltransferase